MKEEKEIKIGIERLQEIARYYEIPLAVFFGGKLPKKTTRNKEWYKAYLKLQKIKKVIKE